MTLPTRLPRRALATSLLLAVAACGSDGSGSTGTTGGTPASLVATDTALYHGQRARLGVVARDASGAPVRATGATWTASYPTALAIAGTGDSVTVTALRPMEGLPITVTVRLSSGVQTTFALQVHPLLSADTLLAPYDSAVSLPAPQLPEVRWTIPADAGTLTSGQFTAQTTAPRETVRNPGAPIGYGLRTARPRRDVLAVVQLGSVADTLVLALRDRIEHWHESLYFCFKASGGGSSVGLNGMFQVGQLHPGGGGGTLPLGRLEWAVADTTLATVSATGYLTPKKAGFTTLMLTFADHGLTAAYNLTLLPPDTVANGTTCNVPPLPPRSA